MIKTLAAVLSVVATSFTTSFCGLEEFESKNENLLAEQVLANHSSVGQGKAKLLWERK